MKENLKKNKESKPVRNIHDTAVRGVLLNKKELTILLNREIDFKEKIKKEEIQYVNSRFVTKRQRNRESDMIIKLNNQKIYLILEHQSKIDYSMPYRTEEYTMETLRQTIDKEKIKNKNYEYPTVIAIVFYTGKKKWNAKKYIEIKECINNYNHQIGKYIVIDMSIYSNEKLLKMEGALAKIVILDRLTSKEIGNVSNLIIQIYKSVKDKDERLIIDNYLKEVFSNLINDKEVKETIKKLSKKGGKDNMLRETILKMLKNERKEGRKEGSSQVAINMLKEKYQKDEIKKCTGLKDADIEKLEKSLQKV